MKNFIFVFVSFLILTFVGCEKEEPAKELKSDVPNARVVKVVEFMDASNYTYIKVEEKGEEYWIAVPQMEIEEGAVLYYTKSMRMEDFRSETLDRTFDVVFFVEDVSKTPHNTSQISSHPTIISSKEEVKVEPLKGGYTIAQVYDEKKSLNGKTVKLRGKVTKFNEDILDRNWIHLQDGTGEQGKHDLVVTSKEPVQLGETIVVEGTVAADKDFGSGYTYSVLIEDAKIKTE